MAGCKNEEDSLCEANFINDLSNQVNATFQQIEGKSETSRIVYNNVLTSFTDWRRQKLEKIEQIYINHLQPIETQQVTLNKLYLGLLTYLKDNATQPLERVQRQKNTNTEILNYIRQTIERVRGDCGHLKWNFSIPLPNDIEFSFSNFPSIPMPVHKPIMNTIDKEKQIESTITPRKNRRYRRASLKILSTQGVKFNQVHTSQRLVRMFANLSSIGQSKNAIDIYMTNCKLKLFLLVNAYLTAWNQKSEAEEKIFLLNEHISTIRTYSIYRRNDFDVLVGIQIFLFNQIFYEEKSKIMSFLLQFFLDHQCINQNLIFDWYNNNDAHGYMGYEEAKQLIEPFIESVLTINTGAQATSTYLTTLD